MNHFRGIAFFPGYWALFKVTTGSPSTEAFLIRSVSYVSAKAQHSNRKFLSYEDNQVLQFLRYYPFF